MRAGRLDRRVTIQARTAAQNSAHGETTYTWADVATVWAAVQDLRGREYFAAQQEQAEVSTRFTMRWRTGVTVLNRLVYDGKTYNIRQVAELGRRAGLEILADAEVT